MLKIYNARKTPEGCLRPTRSVRKPRSASERSGSYTYGPWVIGQSSVPLCVGRILFTNEKIGCNVLVCMGEVLKNHIFFVK